MEFTDQPLEPFGTRLLDMSVDNNLGYKTPLVFRIIHVLQKGKYLPSYGCHMAEVILEEALANAMVHGNKLDPAKKVQVAVFGDGQRFGVVIEDQGAGFTAKELPSRDDPDTLLRERGRGIMLMDHYMEKVRYNAKGNRLWMSRARQIDPDPGAKPPGVVPDEPELRPGEIAPLEDLKPVDAPAKRAYQPVVLPDEIQLDSDEDELELERAEGPVTFDEQHGVTVATVHEIRITESSADAIRVPLLEHVGKPGRVVIDMRNVEFMSSIGIAALMAVFKKATASKCKMAFAGVQPAVVNVFTATGLQRLFMLEPDVASAAKKIR